MNYQDEIRPLPVRRPVVVPAPKFVATRAYAGLPEKGVDIGARGDVSCISQPPSAACVDPETTTAPEPGPQTRMKAMTLQFKSLSKNSKNAFYTGAAVALRIPLSAFPGKTAPTSIEVADGALEPAKQPKAKMTAEERKAARAAKPKPTLAEKIAAREAALAKLKAKAEADAAGAGM
jgi:hypothetical protein